MNVLFVSAEVDPFAKVGGLADVVGSLPKALRNLGIDARVLMPCYRFINQDHYNIEYLFSFDLERPVGTSVVDLYHTVYDGVPIYFLRGWPFFGEESSVYSEWAFDMPRYIFFSQATLPAVEMLSERLGWFPDVMHVNDWHTGLLPFLIDERRKEDSRWQSVGTMITIHNMAYQGEYAGGWLWELGIPSRDNHDGLVARGLTDNLLAIGLAYADIITTVSPRYAIEIQYPYMGYGLDDLLRTRLDDLHGILNGIDVELWNPETDPGIAVNYNADSFRDKRIFNKRQLQAGVGLKVSDTTPVIGMVSRLVWQKGLDLALPALRRILEESGDAQVVILGSGAPEYDEQVWRLSADFRWRAHAFIGYNEAVGKRIYSGCDLFLMPSHYEPCGVGQMIAMRYGALPLVRETGGLADTVQNYDNDLADHGTGFSFQWQEPEAVVNTLRWAMTTFRNNPDAWQRMQERAMRTDFSWSKSAREYVTLYDQAKARHP
ncbi:MAG: glycogen synthase [Chloroflexi bacterium]|nr:glycogen synthase [Chloroflexota bacterium]